MQIEYCILLVHEVRLVEDFSRKKYVVLSISMSAQKGNKSNDAMNMFQDESHN